ncbi:uncharacterized protein LOC105771985 [Gossypium raimondii]|uniref:uncharacterized protein LOC105771985 n=1 Tax=Gossypium raimondii TaxID=29730 RepID=UPI00063AB7F1|nr:uncharacterized protein LOC105771985 [Gossypium raimondii]
MVSTIMNQRKYALELIADLGLTNAKPAPPPLEQNLKMTSLDYDAALDIHDATEELADASVYQRLIGRLLYLTNTRPGIAFGVQHLSQFMHKPKKSIMKLPCALCDTSRTIRAKVFFFQLKVPPTSKPIVTLIGPLAP